MLFVCSFAEELSPLLVDAKDAEHARAIATETADGVAPAAIVEVPPGIFVAELFVEDDGGEVIDVAPLEHAIDYLEKVDAALSGEPIEQAAECGAEAEADEEIVICRRAPHADGKHEGVTTDGEIVLW